MKRKIPYLLLIIPFGLLVWIYYHQNPAAQNGFFPGCPTYSILGMYCPGCGSQRAFHYLLHGEVVKALRYNPLFVIAAPVILGLAAHYAYGTLTGTETGRKCFENRNVLLLIFIIMLLFFIARNLPFHQLDFLKPPVGAL